MSQTKWTVKTLRSAFITFFTDRGHQEILSASLVPLNDPTTLFVGSGMQPLIPYLLGEKHPKGDKLVNLQKSFRAQDIEEVGDNRHTTYFEMMGNWSLGSYFKKEELAWKFEFFTKALEIDPKRIYVTVFLGNDQVDEDTISVEIWKELFESAGIDGKYVKDAVKNGMQDGRIFGYSEKKNWWSRSGEPANMPPGEPGGPDSEFFYDLGEDLNLHQDSEWKDLACHVNCDCGRFIEIGNSVFMQYKKLEDGSFVELAQHNVDFGGGCERILAALQNHSDVFRTDIFWPLIQKLQELTGVEYEGENLSHFRVIVDHLRASVMLIGDGVEPSNKAQGYVLRRLIRRAVRHGRELSLQKPFLSQLVPTVLETSAWAYPETARKADAIQASILEEEQRFMKTIAKGFKEIEKISELNGELAFKLYETYGFPFELTEEIARERGQNVEYGEFRQAFERHKETSRTASKGMFKGGLADSSEATTKYHTATHLLHSALREVLGDHVEQQGSNITGERLRFDFTHSSALTEQEIQEVEQKINAFIQSELPVHREMLPKEQALKEGAMAFFLETYPDEVSVYTIGKDAKSDWISKELCGGPHVANTKEIGSINLYKQESIGAGKRRVYLRFGHRN